MAIPISPQSQPRRLKHGSPSKGYAYIPYMPGLEDKSRVVEELTRDVCDHIISSNLSADVGLLPSCTRNEVVSCVTQHFDSLPPKYSLDKQADDVLLHMKLLNKRIRNDQVIVSCQYQNADCPQSNNIVRIIFVCVDRPKIFNRIIAALDKFTLSTFEADIMTTKNGKVFDRLVVEVLPEFATNLPRLEMLLTNELENILSPPIGTATTTIRRRIPSVSSEESQFDLSDH